MDEVDIWRSAKALVDSYGDDATIHAAMRADELLAQGDLDGAGTWRRSRNWSGRSLARAFCDIKY